MVRIPLLDIPGWNTSFKTSLLFIVAALLSSTAAQNATPTLPPFAEGYYQLDSQSAWSMISCFNDKTFTSAGEYATCCENTSSGCAFPTACKDHTVYFVDDYYTCESSEPCRTLTIYDYPGSDKSAKDIFCYDHWDVETVYRRTTTPSTTTSSSSTSSTLTPGPSLTTSLPTATATSTTTKSPNSDNSDSDSDSQAWIAGAVIGPVAGCAILAGLAFWLFRRRKRANTQAEPAPVTSALPPQYGQMENVKYGGGGQPLSELPGSYYVPKQQERPLSELGGS